MRIVVAPDKFKLTGLESWLAGADLVITGEGSLDAQSLAGKAPVGVARAAARHGVPVVAVAGRNTLTADELGAAGLLRRVGQMIARDRLAEVVTGNDPGR
jgi:glycerate kinase